MNEYGQMVGQGTKNAGSGHSTGGGGGLDVGASIAASLTDALNHTSTALGVPPAVLLVVALAVVLVAVYLVFVR